MRRRLQSPSPARSGQRPRPNGPKGPARPNGPAGPKGPARPNGPNGPNGPVDLNRPERAHAGTGRPSVTEAAPILVAWTGLALAGWAVGAIIVAAGPRFDAGVVTDLHATAHTTLASVAGDVTFFGSPLWLDLVFAIASVALGLGRRWRSAAFLFLASPGAAALHAVIETLVNRARPLGRHLTAASGPSFPSGHATESLALYGALVLLAVGALAPLGLAGPTARRAWSAPLIAVAALGLLAIGLSRLVLGVHFPSDVIAGWLIAGTWLGVLTRWTRGLRD